jgi:hypothetical protein
MQLPLGPQQWTALIILAALILLDAALAWVKNASRGTFTWAKFGLFVRKQFYVLGSAILLAVAQKYGPPSLQALTSVTWWAGAIAVALQYVIGDILGTKLGLIGGGGGLPAAPPSTGAEAK